MTRLSLVVPKVEELWFRQKCMSNPKTMAYNAGYQVSYDGYHYESGCIDFPKEKWEKWHSTRLSDEDLFYAYILDEELNQFVGYVNFKINRISGKASMGILIDDDFRGRGYMRPALMLLIEKAKEKGVKALTDTVPKSRERALKVFFDLGFEIVDTFTVKKFDKDDEVFAIEKKL